MSGIKIKSNNFNGKSVEITFNPFTGGTINLGTQTIPYDYVSSNYEGDYSIYIPEYDKTCPLRVGVPPSPTPSATSSPTPSITPTMTPTPTPSAPSIDPDAAAYLADVVASGGTTDATIEAAVDTLFTSLKSNGLYSKIYAMYPYVGGTASSHAIEAKLNKTFDITWNGGMTHGISGSTGDGINGYGNTNVLLGDLTSLSANTLGFYQINNQQVSANRIDLGSIGGSSGNHCIHISSNLSGSANFRNQDRQVSISTSTPLDNSGGWINTRLGTGTTDANVYFRGNTTPIMTSTKGLGILNVNDEYLVFNASLGGSSPLSGYYSDNTHSFTFIMDDGLSASEVSTLDGIINTFQTSLGRNTY